MHYYPLRLESFQTERPIGCVWNPDDEISYTPIGRVRAVVGWIDAERRATHRNMIAIRRRRRRRTPRLLLELYRTAILVPVMALLLVILLQHCCPCSASPQQACSTSVCSSRVLPILFLLGAPPPCIRILGAWCRKRRCRCRFPNVRHCPTPPKRDCHQCINVCTQYPCHQWQEHRKWQQ